MGLPEERQVKGNRLFRIGGKVLEDRVHGVERTELSGLCVHHLNLEN